MTCGQKLRQGRDHPVVALIAFARIHAADGQQHPLVLQAPAPAQRGTVARRESLTDGIGEHPHPLRCDRRPFDHAGARVARDAEDEVGGLHGVLLQPARALPGFDPMHLDDQLRAMPARNPQGQRRHVQMAAEHHLHGSAERAPQRRLNVADAAEMRGCLGDPRRQDDGIGRPPRQNRDRRHQAAICQSTQEVTVVLCDPTSAAEGIPHQGKAAAVTVHFQLPLLTRKRVADRRAESSLGNKRQNSQFQNGATYSNSPPTDGMSSKSLM